MKLFLFTLKRSAGKPLFLLLLFLCAAAIPLAGGASRTAEFPPAGVCSLSTGTEAEEITHYLLENDFLLYTDPLEMERDVERGVLDCAAILPADLTQRMEDGEMEGCVTWIVTPTSFIPSLYQSHLSAALYRAYAPFLTAPIFEGTGVSREEVFRSYEAMFEEGYAFSFDVHTAQKGGEPARVRERSMMTGAAAILLCALILSSCGEVLGPSFREMLGRLGLRKALLQLVLPGTVLRTVLAAGAGCIGLSIAGAADLLLPLVIYVFLLTGLSLVLAALLPGVRQLYTLLALLIPAAAALCPIFTDLALFSPALGAVRLLVPPYWLWLIPQAPLLWALGALLLCLGGLGALALRYRLVEKYRLF